MKQWLACLVFFPVLAFSQASDQVVARAESALASLKTFQADFEQVYYSNSVSIPLKEKGHIWFQKPDSMKWRYEDPEEKIFLSKEGIYQYYIPEDNQLFRGRIPKEGHEGEVLTLLSGQKSINDAYDVLLSPLPIKEKNVDQLQLTPKDEDYYSHILLELNKKTGLIRKITLFDWAGNKTEILLKKIKTNMRLSKKIFQLKVPSDAEVIEY